MIPTEGPIMNDERQNKLVFCTKDCHHYREQNPECEQSSSNVKSAEPSNPQSNQNPKNQTTSPKDVSCGSCEGFHNWMEKVEKTSCKVIPVYSVDNRDI